MNIIAIISPLILVGITGFFCAKRGLFNKGQVDTLSKFTFNLSIYTAYVSKQLMEVMVIKNFLLRVLVQLLY